MNNQTKLWLGGGLVVAGATLTTIVLIRRHRKKSATIANKVYDKAMITTATGTKINIVQVAQQLGIDLGTAYPWYDPRHATENDALVLKTMLKFPKELIPALRTEYAKLYNRNLQLDLQNLLDDYDQVSYLFM